MSRYQYRFRSTWATDATPEEVARVLRAPERLHEWAPEICRRSDEIAPGKMHVILRGFLPFWLNTTLVWHESGRRFDVDASGDVEGTGYWLILDGRIEVVQDVEAKHWVLRLMSIIARPLCRANHEWVMNRTHEAIEREIRAKRAPNNSIRGTELPA